MGGEDEEINRVTGKPFAVRKDEMVEQAEARKAQQETNRVSGEHFRDEQSRRDERIAAQNKPITTQNKSWDHRIAAQNKPITTQNKSWDHRIAALIPEPPIHRDENDRVWKAIQKVGPPAEKYGTKLAKSAEKETFKRRKKPGIQRYIPKPINIRSQGISVEEKTGRFLLGVPEGQHLEPVSFLSQRQPVNIFGSHETSRDVHTQQRPSEQGTSPSIFGSSKPISLFGTNKKKLGWL